MTQTMYLKNKAVRHVFLCTRLVIHQQILLQLQLIEKVHHQGAQKANHLIVWVFLDQTYQNNPLTIQLSVIET
jgi:hypothetical protein